MKRVLIAVLVATTVAVGVYAAAASLTVNSDTIGAGNSAVAACQSSALSVSYATSYSATLPGYRIGTVTVNGLDTASATNCASKAYRITLTGASNASLGEVSGTTPGSGTSFAVDFSASNIPAASLTGVHLVVSG